MRPCVRYAYHVKKPPVRPAHATVTTAGHPAASTSWCLRERAAFPTYARFTGNRLSAPCMPSLHEEARRTGKRAGMQPKTIGSPVDTLDS